MLTCVCSYFWYESIWSTNTSFKMQLKLLFIFDGLICLNKELLHYLVDCYLDTWSYIFCFFCFLKENGWLLDCLHYYYSFLNYFKMILVLDRVLLRVFNIIFINSAYLFLYSNNSYLIMALFPW